MILERIEKILRLIDEKKDIYSKNIINSSPNSFEEYKFICGKVYGLEEAEKIIKESFNNTVEERIFFK